MQGKKADLDKEKVLELTARLWTLQEVAAFMGVSLRTIYNYVTAEELAAARERGKGKLIDMAWERAATDSKILLHMLQFHRGEIVQTRACLADATDQELAVEVQKRMARHKAAASAMSPAESDVRAKQLAQIRLEAASDEEP